MTSTAVQYNASALRNETRNAIEAFEKAMQSVAAKAAINPHFPAVTWTERLKDIVADLLASNGDFISLIDEADQGLAESEERRLYGKQRHHLQAAE